MQMPTFNDRYLGPLIRTMVWTLLLAPLGSFLHDDGSVFAFLGALAAYVVLLLVVVLRHPAQPTRTDLLLVSWGLPVLDIVGMGIRVLFWYPRPVA